MSKQPEALRLADECDEGMVDFSEVAAELRRQHGEIESMRAERLRTEQRLLELVVQRDELLEALEGIIKAEHSEGRGGSGFTPKSPTLEHQQRVYQAWQKAHAAIAKVEEKK